MKQFEGYEEYLKQSELSKQTRQVYLREAEKFVRYLNGKEITKDRTMLYREKFKELEYFKNKFEKGIFVNHLQIELKRKRYKKEIIFKV